MKRLSHVQIIRRVFMALQVFAWLCSKSDAEINQCVQESQEANHELV